MKSNDLVLDLFIPDEDKAMDIFKRIRWANGLYCPDCKSFKIYIEACRVSLIVIHVKNVD